MKKEFTSVRIWMIIFIVALLLSGITAFAPEAGLRWLLSLEWKRHDVLYHWISQSYEAIKTTHESYPSIAYGYDWLAFAHIVIAMAFLGPLKDPVRNIWVIQFGRIACVMIFPVAFIAGAIRQIPLFWQLLDCSFGIIGLIPLSIIYTKIKRLEAGQNKATEAYYNPL